MKHLIFCCITWFFTDHSHYSLKLTFPDSFFVCNLLLPENARSNPTALTLFIKPSAKSSALFYFYPLRGGRVKSSYTLTSKSSGSDELSQDEAVDSRQRSIIERVCIRTSLLGAVSWQMWHHRSAISPHLSANTRPWHATQSILPYWAIM